MKAKNGEILCESTNKINEFFSMVCKAEKLQTSEEEIPSSWPQIQSDLFIKYVHLAWFTSHFSSSRLTHFPTRGTFLSSKWVEEYFPFMLKENFYVFVFVCAKCCFFWVRTSAQRERMLKYKSKRWQCEKLILLLPKKKKLCLKM